VVEGGKNHDVKVIHNYAGFNSPMNPEEVRESGQPSLPYEPRGS
jgi:hypothetical protein